MLLPLFDNQSKNVNFIHIMVKKKEKMNVYETNYTNYRVKTFVLTLKSLHTYMCISLGTDSLEPLFSLLLREILILLIKSNNTYSYLYM